MLALRPKKIEEAACLWVSLRYGETGVLFQSFKKGGGYWIHVLFLSCVPKKHTCIWGGYMQEVWAFKGDWFPVFKRVLNKITQKLSYVV